MVENVSPKQVWSAMGTDKQAQMVDVRTDAEWTYVGLPDLTEAGKQPVLIPWQRFPSMQVDADFVDHLREAGFPHAYNIADGFEGPPDADGHRGTVSGWKADGLPWRQR